VVQTKVSNVEVDLQSLFGLHVTCRIRGRYWSAKIDDISLKPPDGTEPHVLVQQVKYIWFGFLALDKQCCRKMRLYTLRSSPTGAEVFGDWTPCSCRAEDR
jgi:hypothetical protein